MVKKKTKKQRKQWRKINHDEVEDYHEKTTREQQQGLDFEGIPDADLFFVDKATEEETTAVPAPTSRKIYHRQRLTRAQAILQAIHSTKPAFELPKKKQKNNTTTKSSDDNKIVNKNSSAAGSGKASKNKNALAVAQPTTTKRTRKAANDNQTSSLDLWDDDGDNNNTSNNNNKKKSVQTRNNTTTSLVAAIRVDDPGCSFNPDKELHQDAVAVAVAAEMKKIYDHELAPKPPIAFGNYDPQMDELALLQVDAEEDESEEEEDEDDIENSAAARAKKNEKKTKKDRNRELKRKAIEEAQQKAKKEKKLRADLANLKKIQSEVEETLEERELKRKRQLANKAEKAASQPPRLGKHKFEDMPVQVLTTEELEGTQGSLRLLKPTAMLAKDRFKSLQRRGIIEPRKKVSKKVGRKIKYIPGERADKALERQAEVEEMRSKKGRKK